MLLKRILIVDDTPKMLALVKTIIETCTQEGSEITTAVNGKDALSKIKDLKNIDEFFDMIVSDCDMPKMDGIALCRQVMEKKTVTSPIFVLMSEKDQKTEAKEAGVDYFFLKGGADFFGNLKSLFKQP